MVLSCSYHTRTHGETIDSKITGVLAEAAFETWIPRVVGFPVRYVWRQRNDPLIRFCLCCDSQPDILSPYFRNTYAYNTRLVQQSLLSFRRSHRFQTYFLKSIKSQEYSPMSLSSCQYSSFIHYQEFHSLSLHRPSNDVSYLFVYQLCAWYIWSNIFI